MKFKSGIKNFSGKAKSYASKAGNMAGFNRPNPKKMNFNINKASGMKSSYRPTDMYDRMGHSGGFRGKSAQKAASEYRNLGAISSTVKDNIGLNGGWKSIAGQAGAGAIAGGAAGAGINTIRGEDAWDGAMRGAAMGAIGNATVKGSKMAMGAGKKEKMANAFNSFNAETGMTKSVKSLYSMRKDSAYANKMLKNK